MCGISGFADFRKQTSVEILQKMNRTMVHRGPDGEGYAMYDSDKACIGLGHRRLSIIDLSEAGAQPQHFDHLHITFNGEIYNYREIKKELQEKGHQFGSHSDTEVILHAYAEWGEKCLHRFIGMFAFVIYDEQKQELFACRDRAGVKPFLYYWDKDLFLFGSELKAIMAHPQFLKDIDLDAAAAYMQFGYVPAPHCIFKKTYKLNPGHFLKLSLKTKETKTEQYWNVYDYYNKATLDISFEDAVLETERILKNAFQYRMVSDVPVGVFLSSGYDSTCVTALLQKDSTDKIKTFTIGVPDAGLNEAPAAKDIALHLGTDHTEYYCTEKEALEIIPQIPFFYDEPFADNSAIPTTLVSRIASEKVTVALSADAGDEVFAGYNRYDYICKFENLLNRVPKLLRKATAAIMDKIPASYIPVLNQQQLFYSRYEKMMSLLRDPSVENMLINLTKQMNDSAISRLFLLPVKKLSTAFDSNELEKNYLSPLPYIMAVDYETYLPDDILQKVDRATMSVSLEGREPFLDQRIIEWAATLPLSYKYNKGNKKYILKEIVHKYIPKELMNRPKMGFGIPIENWLMNDLKKFTDYYFDPVFIKNQGIFNNNEIQKIFSSFYHGKKERAEKIWYLLMFQMWYDKWMNSN
ncbi:MAG: asparagine synthase (glutamine-hydrolyzing) [Ferruginibacter sp.]